MNHDEIRKQILGSPYYRRYEQMGAHLCTVDNQAGVLFSVWAPNASRLSVIGNFNGWNRDSHIMESLGDCGIWALFVPGLQEGELYKFLVYGDKMYREEKADPYGFCSEIRPQTSSVVWNTNKYDWNDSAWMNGRPQQNWLHQPISVYEVHLGSWKRKADEGDRFLTYREYVEELIPYVVENGFTHIELMPITEHPFDGSWGYQCLGYFSPTTRFGSPDDFKFFVDACHQAGIGVIVDWVPAHFPKDGHGLAYFDGTHLYEHADPRAGEHADWGTLIYNFGRNEVKDFLLSSAIFWADVYHIDGIRVDAVASMLYLDYSREDGEWLPNQFGGNHNLEAIAFLKEFNAVVHREYPGILTFAEESTSFPGVSHPTDQHGLGFGMKWNMGWMNDTLEYIEKDSIHRKHHQGDLTFSLIYSFHENFILPFSHDEVVHGKGSMINKMPGDDWQKFANLRLLYSYMYMHPGKKLLFQGCEFGQWNEWNHDVSLDWHLAGFDRHQQLLQHVKQLNHLYRDEKPLHDLDFVGGGFEWIAYDDAENSVISFLRKARNGEYVVCIMNFTPIPRNNYLFGVPETGEYTLLHNSDDACWNGGGYLVARDFQTSATKTHGRPATLEISLPALSCLVLKKK
jgi:1,4-alpha-glucan branching enzyme